MKLAFSTLGVPGMPMSDVAALAVGAGYRGVELRAHPEEPVHPGIGEKERAEVVAVFADAGVEILAVAGYAKVAAPGDDAPVLAEIQGLLELARDLGAPYVRVFPGAGDSTGDEDADEGDALAPEAALAGADARAARRLGAAAELADDHGVRILLETHDSHRTGVDAARVVAAVGHPNVGVLWDVMHTWLGGESPATSHGVLAPYLGYAQVKDIASAEDTTPLALGAGVLPLAECLALLGPDQWVCWEYEKRWYPGAAELPGLLAAGREHLALLASGPAA
ncbi:sugar phosphate isomerase/epimerase family protein [Streptomyces sp. NPDC058657]|uniref:sugar phosphate isomerase/epimerase family protein n=1 Tax=unclassified Streptomyces TaxID=2593676 RepID=UPI003647FD8A